MGSRCGDMDPAVVLYLMQKGGLSAHEADLLMNKKSGFLGMCGHADVRAVLQASDGGDERAQTALEVRKYYAKGASESGFTAGSPVSHLTFTSRLGRT